MGQVQATLEPAISHDSHSIVAVASLVTAACCCVYQVALVAKPNKGVYALPHKSGCSKDVEAPSLSPPAPRRQNVIQRERASTCSSNAPPAKVRPPVQPLRLAPTALMPSECRSAPTSPHRAPPDGVLVDAFFYRFYLERGALPPGLQLEEEPCKRLTRGSAQSAPALSLIDVDSLPVSAGAALCRSPTSACKLSCLAELPPESLELPSSMAEFREFDI